MADASVLPRRTQAALVLLCFLCGVAAFGVYATSFSSRQGMLVVAFLDVGQGDAIYIESPTGVQVVIDGGPDASLVREISDVLPLWDRTIDSIIITNPDQDHFAGFIDLLARFKVSQVFEPGVLKNSSTYQTLQRQITENNVTRLVPKRGQRIELGGGVYLQILFPDRDVAKLESNPGSLIMRLVYGKTSVMLMGDSVESVEDFVVALDGEALQSQILKLGHHGSRTSSGEKLLDAVAPAVAIVSAGCDNSYGHPHKEVTDRLATRSIPYLWTCKEGTIEFVSNGEVWRRQ